MTAATEPSREELVLALAKACDVATWMSGSPSFGPEGKAHEGWIKQRERLFAALDVLNRVKGAESNG